MYFAMAHSTSKKEGAAARREYISRYIASLGGTLEAFNFCFGEHDVATIVELSGNTQAAAASLAISTSTRCAPACCRRSPRPGEGAPRSATRWRRWCARTGPAASARRRFVLIASDGLDVGDLRVLRDAMRELHRRAAGIVWLNPLLETPGYEPSAAGMRAALPYVSTFAWAGDPAGFARVAETVALR